MEKVTDASDHHLIMLGRSREKASTPFLTRSTQAETLQRQVAAMIEMIQILDTQRYDLLKRTPRENIFARMDGLRGNIKEEIVLELFDQILNALKSKCNITGWKELGIIELIQNGTVPRNFTCNDIDFRFVTQPQVGDPDTWLCPALWKERPRNPTSILPPSMQMRSSLANPTTTRSFHSSSGQTEAMPCDFKPKVLIIRNDPPSTLEMLYEIAGLTSGVLSLIEHEAIHIRQNTGMTRFETIISIIKNKLPSRPPILFQEMQSHIGPSILGGNAPRPWEVAEIVEENYNFKEYSQELQQAARSLFLLYGLGLSHGEIARIASSIEYDESSGGWKKAEEEVEAGLEKHRIWKDNTDTFYQTVMLEKWFDSLYLQNKALELLISRNQSLPQLQVQEQTRARFGSVLHLHC